ncbi:MAG: hypothetical protein ABI624_09385, partial [Casimicrobiaceae bacterium]
MRLTQWKLHPVHLPYHRVIKWRDHVESGSDFLLLAIESDEGDRGVAEVTVKPTWNGESLRSLIAAIEDFFMPSLKNADIGDPASLTAAFSVFPENQTARTLID